MDHRATLESGVRLITAEEPRDFPARRDAAVRSQDTPGTMHRESSSGVTILVDQAIFTSARGPTAEGYRIVAATPTITPAERAEITRRSPSHGNLHDDRSSDAALSAYPIESGRYCVAISRPAGVEHSGRGGQCVRTHIAILDDAAYRAFACNPATVHAAIRRADDAHGTMPLRPILDSLRLEVPPRLALTIPGDVGIDWLLSLTADLLEGERLIVAGLREELATLNALAYALPLAVRRELSVSCGLRYAAARRLQLSFVTRDGDDLQRAVRGQSLQYHDIATTPQPKTAPYDSWLRLLRRWFETGRAGDVAALTTALTTDTSPTTLNRIARVWTHVDATGNCNDPPSSPSAAT